MKNVGDFSGFFFKVGHGSYPITPPILNASRLTLTKSMNPNLNPIADLNRLLPCDATQKKPNSRTKKQEQATAISSIIITQMYLH